MQELEKRLTTRRIGHPTILLEEVDSTNTYLKEQCLSGRLAHGAALWATTQTAGRGRLGRQWESRAGGNIYTSVLLEPPPDRLNSILSLVAGVAVVQAIASVVAVKPRLKWPNDVVVGNKKLGGILLEAGRSPGPWTIVGIGLNVNGAIAPDLPQATRLCDWAGDPVPREELWLALMHALEALYTEWISQGNAGIVAKWSAVSATLGQMVTVYQVGHRPWSGVAEKIDHDGALWVSCAQGLARVMAGEVSVRQADGRYASDS